MMSPSAVVSNKTRTSANWSSSRSSSCERTGGEKPGLPHTSLCAGQTCGGRRRQSISCQREAKELLTSFWCSAEHK